MTFQRGRHWLPFGRGMIALLGAGPGVLPRPISPGRPAAAPACE